jgi:hypothetical protein
MYSLSYFHQATASRLVDEDTVIDEDMRAKVHIIVMDNRPW